MIQNIEVIKKRYKQFINEVSANKVVWGLKNSEGLATSSSLKYNDSNNKPIELVCFWSNKKLAKVSSKNWGEEYIPSKISLAEFIENWCIGMYNEDILVGVNFDWNMFGEEIEPLVVAYEIIQKLKEQNEDLDFLKFDGIIDIESKISIIFEDEN